MFRRKVDYSDDDTKPIVPDEVFEAVQRVIRDKSCELIRRMDGIYVVDYSPNGPWTEQITSDWLPVFVMRVKQSASGGIKEEELESYLTGKNYEQPETTT